MTTQSVEVYDAAELERRMWQQEDGAAEFQRLLSKPRAEPLPQASPQPINIWEAIYLAELEEYRREQERVLYGQYAPAPRRLCPMCGKSDCGYVWR